MERKKLVGDVGIIVGRFQVPYLHDAHKDLIETVRNEQGKVVIFLGLSPVKVTVRNPLDFEARKQMILDAYPDITVLYIKDIHDDELWSQTLDTQIRDIISPTQVAVLYGSRDSFINHYTGKFPTQELIPERTISGSELRKAVSKKVKCDPIFREGVIWAASNQYPKTWPTVDVAILDCANKRVLLGRKPHEEQYRFIGGFVDPTDASLEAAAIREAHEEAGDMELSSMTYISSHQVLDWRYKNEKDKIMTSFFVCNLMFGSPKPGDDIAEVRWFDLELFDNTGMNKFTDAYAMMVDNHLGLMSNLIEYLVKNSVSLKKGKK